MKAFEKRFKDPFYAIKQKRKLHQLHQDQMSMPTYITTLYEEDQPDTLSEIYQLAHKAEKFSSIKELSPQRLTQDILPTQIPLKHILIVKPQ
jgi:hypothetical protein